MPIKIHNVIIVLNEQLNHHAAAKNNHADANLTCYRSKLSLCCSASQLGIKSKLPNSRLLLLKHMREPKNQRSESKQKQKLHNDFVRLYVPLFDITDSHLISI